MSVPATTMLAALTLVACLALSHVGEAKVSQDVLLSDWQLQSSAVVGAGTTAGQTISALQYDASSWFNITAPATVLAGLVQVGEVQAPFYSTNLANVSTSPFEVPWWYRTEFQVSASSMSRLTFKGTKSCVESWNRYVLHSHMWLCIFTGLNYKANVWIDGALVANASDTAGTFRYFDFDVSKLAASPAQHALAVECFRPIDAAFPPGNNDTDLAISFVDWAPPPPDMNMGLWRETEVHSFPGPVSVRYPQVATVLSGTPTPPGLTAVLGTPSAGVVAHVSVQVQLHNMGTTPFSAVITATLCGVAAQLDVTLQPGEVSTVVLNNITSPSLNIANPRLWWPWQMGPATMETLSVVVSASDGSTSDSLSASVGLREASSGLTPAGYRVYHVNRHPILIRAAGWAPDLFQRITAQRQENEFAYDSPPPPPPHAHTLTSMRASAQST